MLIRFWCDSEITFSRLLHKNLVTVLYFSIINVLCGAGGDASFAPQANLVRFQFCLACLKELGPVHRTPSRFSEILIINYLMT